MTIIRISTETLFTVSRGHKIGKIFCIFNEQMHPASEVRGLTAILYVSVRFISIKRV